MQSRPDKHQAQQVADFQRLVHQLFKQDERGAIILEHWRNEVLMAPGNARGSDLYMLGLQEGRKEFVRQIIAMINQAEKGNERG